MDSEEEKELKKELEKELEILLGNFENTIKSLFDKDIVEQKSLLNRILNYILFTLIIFFIGLFSIVKKIILFKFLQIPMEFKIMGKMDGILRKYLMF
jgi:hypothetical protein